MTRRFPVSYLKSRFAIIAKDLGWNTGERWHRDADGEMRCVVGHIALEHNSVYGWQINQTMNEGGGERLLMSSRKAAEFASWLDGVEYAINRRPS